MDTLLACSILALALTGTLSEGAMELLIYFPVFLFFLFFLSSSSYSRDLLMDEGLGSLA